MYTKYMKAEKSSTQVVISPSTILFTLGSLITLLFLFKIHQIVISFFMAVIVMSALNPMVKVLQRKLHLPKILAILLVYALFIAIIVFAFMLIIPPLIVELPNLITALALPPLPENIRTLKLSPTQINDLFTQFQSSFSTIYSIISSTFSGIFTMVTVLVMSSYLLIDREILHLKVSWFTNEKRHIELARQLVNSIETQLGGWVRGQALLMLVIGIVTYIGLRLLSVPYALPLAILAGMLEVLPNIGPTLAAVPAVLITYSVLGPAMAGFVTLYYVIVQQLENNFIVPKIMKDNADVNPLTTILVILIGLKLAGVIGALLGVPIYIVFRSLYAAWLQETRKKPLE